MEYFLMFIGFVFFIWGMNKVGNDQREQRDHKVTVDRELYARRINEQREFGSLPVSKDPQEKPDKKK